MRRLTNIGLYRYDEENNSWVFAAQRTDSYSSSVSAAVNRLGKYSVVGRR